MASIQKSAEKPNHMRKAGDKIRIKSGHMLTFDHLVRHENTSTTERHVAVRVLRKNIEAAVSCVALPLAILYFAAYITATRLHEDITNVYLQENTMRNAVDNIMGLNQGAINNVDDVWTALQSMQPGSFLDVFFGQTDIYGAELPKNRTETMWGDRGLVAGYSQIQGAVRVSQWRATKESFGAHYACNSDITCALCRANTGFQTQASFTNEVPKAVSCGSWPNRLLEEEVQAAAPAGSARRLDLINSYDRTSFIPVESTDINEAFVFWLFPSETVAQTLERLQYFSSRNWIDQDTYNMQIRMYLMNAELGRNRLEQLTITIFVASAGNIVYARDLQALFLTFHYGMLSKVADLIFFVILMVTSIYRIWEMWTAFIKRKLFKHGFQLYTVWEWAMIALGWWSIYGYYNMWFVWEPDILRKLEPVHKRGWDIGPNDVDKVAALFNSASVAADGYSSMRVIYAQYAVGLMFRFFVSFGTQPRLAVVLNTMINVTTDLIHFIIILVPIFFTYVISGTLLFGRRVESFSTIQGAIGVCYRIIIESEYEWEAMSQEYYWAAAIWAWSYLMMVVMLFMNMLLAIILDVYTETSQKSFMGNPIWVSFADFAVKSFRFRHWVPDHVLEARLKGELSTETMITRELLEAEFPNMSESQKRMFFKACRAQMQYEAEGELDKKNLLKLSSSVMDTLDMAHQVVTKVVMDEGNDPLKPWVTPKPLSSQLPMTDNLHNFLVKPVLTKGGKQPSFEPPGTSIQDSYSAGGPEWLRAVWGHLREQRAWLDRASWQLQQMQWQLQQAHAEKGATGAEMQPVTIL